MAPLSYGPGHDSGGGGREHELEEPGWVQLVVHAVGEEVTESDEAVGVGTVGQGPTNGPVGNAANENIKDVLDQDVYGVLCSVISTQDK